MTAYEIISKKRDGLSLSAEEIKFFINNYTTGRIADYQMSALLMAIFLNGMDDQESRFLTDAYLHSGQVLDLSEIPGIKVDKHSTGGVGDKVSIILAPIVAAAGIPVPMISGRGLGHSGGTLDKLESITGFRIDYTRKEFIDKLKTVGACLIGQTKEIAPADKKIYALRDVTATVQSIPLIAASIMSKKIAEGIDALVLDVKTGVGAFMSSYEKSLNLARTLIRIGEEAGKKTVAYITDMNSPLGRTVGNWLEIVECIDCLKNKGPNDLMEITHLLSGTMIYLGGKSESIEDGISLSKHLLKDGSAWEQFLRIVDAQDGDVALLKEPEFYAESEFKADFPAPEDGWIKSINAFEVGTAAVLLGAGRQRSEDMIDYKAGVRFYFKPGEKVNKGDLLFTLYTDKKEIIPFALEKISAAITTSPVAVSPPRLIHTYLDKTNI
jgi:pyrimidine-nucleoside phosphorylase